MSYAQEQIDRANQVNLKQFLRSQGEELVKSGREYRWKDHDSLTVKGNKWFRHSQSKGGYPIDFVMEFYDKTFPEAMQMLIGEEAFEIAAEPGPKAEFRLPPRCESNPAHKAPIEDWVLSILLQLYEAFYLLARSKMIQQHE